MNLTTIAPYGEEIPEVSAPHSSPIRDFSGQRAFVPRLSEDEIILDNLIVLKEERFLYISIRISKWEISLKFKSGVVKTRDFLAEWNGKLSNLCLLASCCLGF
jgi:hypothetical protein